MMDFKNVCKLVPVDIQEEITFHPYEHGKDEGVLQIKHLMNDGYIEHVNVFMPPFGYVSMLVDEDGISKGLPVNPRATKLYWANVQLHEPVQHPANELNYVYGPAVVFFTRLE